ncbi:hypothetical protein K431DRAFT_289092 [Polychaeton citri CBS 116435]|uniref:Uncharacterized protein n=1 Tax=Polychaeton citri CBS 116435 TaxID=1314669 RepID=A0A9P4PXL7_9PEZI|nr:hypothetical protein K431DRAFT_289092 [Polychaeton citri CBS 116435]
MDLKPFLPEDIILDDDNNTRHATEEDLAVRYNVHKCATSDCREEIEKYDVDAVLLDPRLKPTLTALSNPKVDSKLKTLQQTIAATACHKSVAKTLDQRPHGKLELVNDFERLLASAPSRVFEKLLEVFPSFSLGYLLADCFVITSNLRDQLSTLAHIVLVFSDEAWSQMQLESRFDCDSLSTSWNLAWNCPGYLRSNSC